MTGDNSRMVRKEFFPFIIPQFVLNEVIISKDKNRRSKFAKEMNVKIYVIDEDFDEEFDCVNVFIIGRYEHIEKTVKRICQLVAECIDQRDEYFELNYPISNDYIPYIINDQRIEKIMFSAKCDCELIQKKTNSSYVSLFGTITQLMKASLKLHNSLKEYDEHLNKIDYEARLLKEKKKWIEKHLPRSRRNSIDLKSISSLSKLFKDGMTIFSKKN